MIHGRFPRSPKLLELFSSISRLQSAPGAESRVYDLILGLFNQVKVNNPNESSLEFVLRGGGQLEVRWTNDRTSKRRTCMVAHTDTECHMITFLDFDVGSDRRIRARISGGPPFKSGAEIVFTIGSGRDGHYFRAIIDDIDIDSFPQNGGISATLNLDYDSAGKLLQVWSDATDLDRRIITGSLTYGLETPGASQFLRDSEDSYFAAPFVDNAAGVAVATHVLYDIVLHSLPVNVSVLYTTGEESGFTGLLRLIRDEAHSLGNPTEQIAWVVVDSSEVVASLAIGVDAWQSGWSPSGSPNLESICAASTACVRLGDKGCNFDADVSRMLYQSALDCQGHFDVPEIRGIVYGSASDELRRPSLGSRRHARLELGATGVFAGGWCEASVLSEMPSLIRGFGATVELPEWTNRVGSVAIPIRNYRHKTSEADAEVTREPIPEVVHVHALHTAAILLYEACSLHMNYHYGQSSNLQIGFRTVPWHFARSDKDHPPSHDFLLQRWLNRVLDNKLGNPHFVSEWFDSFGLSNYGITANR